MEGKLYKINNIYTLMVNDKMIASNDEDFQIDYEIKKLSLKNCQAIENGYDLDELVKNMGEEFYVFGNYDFENGVKKGFLKALEIIGDNKFILNKDELHKIIDIARLQGEESFLVRYTNEHIIESIRQNEWDVEIELDTITTDDLSSIIGKPKFDSDGCLILKRK